MKSILLFCAISALATYDSVSHKIAWPEDKSAPQDQLSASRSPRKVSFMLDENIEAARKKREASLKNMEDEIEEFQNRLRSTDELLFIKEFQLISLKNELSSIKIEIAKCKEQEEVFCCTALFSKRTESKLIDLRGRSDYCEGKISLAKTELATLKHKAKEYKKEYRGIEDRIAEMLANDAKIV